MIEQNLVFLVLILILVLILFLNQNSCKKGDIMSARRKRGLVPDDGAGGMNGDDPDDGCVARFQRGDRLFGKKKLKTWFFGPTNFLR